MKVENLGASDKPRARGWPDEALVWILEFGVTWLVIQTAASLLAGVKAECGK